MVYRHKLLDRYLHQKEIKNLLLSFGYTNENNVTDYLNRLKGHLKRTECPHEIGAFLGYPADDIYGFIYHKNKGCLLTGEWKVYHNVEKARILFLKYQTCRYALLKRLAQGKTLAEIFCAA